MADSAAWLRDARRRKRLVPIIPNRLVRPPDPGFDRPTYRQRDPIERLVGQLAQLRRVATSYVPAAERVEVR